MKKIILSRTDNLGDVILTLPMAGYLKQKFPGIKVVFLGNGYTKPIINICQNIDEFLNWDKLKDDHDKAVASFKATGADAIIHVFPVKEILKIAKEAGIPVRVATTGRIYSLFYSNKLVKISRRRSNLHEAQLNLKMLKPLGVMGEVSVFEIPSLYGLIPGAQTETGDSRFRLILHPKSKGSAREWGLKNFSHLIEILPPEKFQIFITGTTEEGDQMREFLNRHSNRVNDMTGKMTLEELILFINSCHGLVAASTGPLHIAAALGKRAIGLYAPMRPIFPQRWAPIGTNSSYLVLDKECNDCRRNMDCHCIRQLEPEKVAALLIV